MDVGNLSNTVDNLSKSFFLLNIIFYYTAWATCQNLIFMKKAYFNRGVGNLSNSIFL